jgi:Arc/MetJ-type ribon-helix-helix transcriptional regulator
MKIISDLPEYIVTKIHKLVSEGRYPSISDFLMIAVENQLTLEGMETTDNVNQSLNELESPLGSRKGQYQYPTEDIPILDLSPQPTSDNLWDLWIWGQINRILPIKFAARLLAIESAQQGNFPDKTAFNKISSEVARDFGLFLEKQDSKFNKLRDEKLSTGFPIGKIKEKSQDRFWSQFVGYQRNNGTLTGGLFDFSLANITNNDNGKYNIGLNPQGLALAKLPNPVIDYQEYENSLSDGEIEFFLNHIHSYVPGEASLYKILLGLFNEGVIRREDINNKLSDFVIGSGWSKGLISTQRSGAISRMFEMNLISKKRKGLEVRYLITNKGKSFLERI